MQNYSQIEAVYYCVSNYVGEKYGSFIARETNARELLTLSDKTLITQMLVELAQSQQMPIGGKKHAYDLSDHKQITRYCRGLLSNHLRRDERINGGTPRDELDEVKRGPNGDAEIKALQACLKLELSEVDKQATLAAIEARKAALAAEKSKAIAIDVNSLPEHLKHLAK